MPTATDSDQISTALAQRERDIAVFARAIAANDPRALTRCPLAWAARRTDEGDVRVEIATGPIDAVGFGPTLEAATREAAQRVPEIRRALAAIEGSTND